MCNRIRGKEITSDGKDISTSTIAIARTVSCEACTLKTVVSACELKHTTQRTATSDNVHLTSCLAGTDGANNVNTSKTCATEEECLDR